MDDDPRRFAVYKHQTEQDLRYERQKYKHIIDQQKELKTKIVGLNDALKHAEKKIRKVENDRDELERVIQGRDQIIQSKDQHIDDLNEQLQQ